MCFVSHSSRDGGAERILLETIELLCGQGIDCKVLLPSEGPLSQSLTTLGVDFAVISFTLWMSRATPSLFLRVKAVLNLLKDTFLVAWRVFRWKSDIVWSSTVTVCVGAFAARLLRRPHVWHLQEFGFEDHGLSFLFGKQWSLGVGNRLSARCICLSNALARHYQASITPSKISVIYPSMSLALRDPEGDREFALSPRVGRFRCLIVGALIEGKGQEDAVLAIRHLRTAGVPAELVIVGEGEPGYRNHLEKLVKSQGLGDCVMFAGTAKSALPAMRSADAILICSRSEAFGRVTIEAMWAGKPVIGARCGATAELIQDGVTGLFYNVRESEDLAAKIRYVYENPEIAGQLGRRARIWAERHFSQSRSARDILAVLTSLSGTPVVGRDGRIQAPSNQEVSQYDNLS